jgi:hypothetical protein
MPTYSFRNTDTGEEFEKFLSMSGRETFLELNPNVTQIYVKAPITIHERGTNIKVDNGFREVMSKVKEKYTINNIKDY